MQKKWKYIPWLITGTFIYSLAGYSVYHDLFWVFNTNPYNRLSSNYGQGDIFHFVVQLQYVTGIPIFLLFWAGIVYFLFSFIRKKNQSKEFFLIYFPFLVFFIAHSLFWYLGIFNSAGLKRVLLCIIPYVSIISLYGFNFLSKIISGFNASFNKYLEFILVSYIIIFPFTKNPAALNFKKDLKLNEDQISADRVVDYIKKEKMNTCRIIYAHPYLSELLNLDPFDTSQNVELNGQSINTLKKGDLIVWENWFAVIEKKVSKESLENNSNFKKIFQLSSREYGREISYSVFVKE
jgi:hypothetical protein